MIAVSSAVDDEHRHLHLTDPVDDAVLIDHDETEGKALPQQLADIDGPGERRFKHQRLNVALERKPGRNRRSQRFVVGHDAWGAPAVRHAPSPL